MPSVAEVSPDETRPARELRLDEAYQGRAMFVKVQCKVGEPPSQLSHHPELRFRIPPRAVDGAPLIANGVTIQAKDELELLLRRDRAGCYVCMDEIFVFETTSFDVLCEKERWAVGRLVLEKKKQSSAGSATSGTDGGTGEDGEEEKTEGHARQAERHACAWSLELSPSNSAFATGNSGGSCGNNGEDLSFDGGLSPCQLALELCLVGTCGGRHECMTKEAALHAWKVISPRSFVQHPSLGAIAEMCADEWSDEEDLDSSRSGGGISVDSMSTGYDGQHENGECAAGIEEREIDGGVLSSSSGGGGSDGGGDNAGGDCGSGSRAAVAAAAGWSLVPWKGEMSSISPPRFDRAEVIRNVRKKYEDLMHEYHASAEGSEDLFKGELTWFSAGVRIGVGVGLGVCLGLGLGVGILVNGYKVSRDRLNNMKQAFKYR